MLIEESAYEKINHFVNYIKKVFPETMETHWNYDLLTNTIVYIYQNSDNNWERTKNALLQIIPEITANELDRFFPKDENQGMCEEAAARNLSDYELRKVCDERPGSFIV